MIYLIFVSIIWALSFSIIKGNLTTVDPYFVAFARLTISLIIFIPFFRNKNLNPKIILSLILIGIVQYGLMYVTYIYSFQFLKAYEIALLTIFTPFFVILIYDTLNKKFILIHWITVTLTLIGSGIIIYKGLITDKIWLGILLIQLSNLFFAFGQVYFKLIMKKYSDIKTLNIIPLLFLGGVLVSGIFSLIFTDLDSLRINYSQMISLIYLGAIASGIGFFLWNFGVTKVEAGTLAILNNLKIPLGIFAAYLILKEEINSLQLIFGSILIIFSLFLNEKFSKEKSGLF